MTNDQILIILFGIFYFVYILLSRRKGNFEEFSVAGRGLGGFLIFASLCASYLGPGFTLGLVREGFVSGMLLWYIVPVAGIFMALVGFFISPIIRSKFKDSYSIGDIIGGANSHNHSLVRAAVGISNTLFLSAVIIAMSYAGGELINNVFGFSKFWSITVITLIVVAYSLFGGIRATIQTDVIQFILFVLLIPGLALLMVGNEGFSWSEFQAFSAKSTSDSYQAMDFFTLFALIFTYMVSANGLDAPGIGRYLASRNKQVAKRASTLAGIFIALWLMLMIFMGNVGAYLYPDLENTDQILLFIAQNHYSGAIYGIFIIAMIGVVMSTQDTLLNSAGVSFSEDLLLSFNKDLSDEKKLFYSKAYTVVMGLIAIGIASFLNSILGIILGTIEFVVPVLIPVILFSIFKKTHYWQSAMAAMLVGFIFSLSLNLFISIKLPVSFVSILLSSSAYLICDQFIKRRS